MIEAIRISRAAYPYRITHEEFAERFGGLRTGPWMRRQGARGPSPPRPTPPLPPLSPSHTPMNKCGRALFRPWSPALSPISLT